MSSIIRPNIGRIKVNFEKLANKKLDELNLAVGAFAQDTVNAAKTAAPKNEGRLVNSISSKRIGQYQYELVAQTKYSAYVEFGTKRKVKIPPGAAGIAKEALANARREPGTIEEFEKAITRWVRLKGIRFESAAKYQSGKKVGQNKKLTFEQTAFFIMMKILRVGIEPQPFFYPAIIKNRRKLNNEVRKIIRK